MVLTLWHLSAELEGSTNATLNATDPGLVKAAAVAMIPNADRLLSGNGSNSSSMNSTGTSMSVEDILSGPLVDGNLSSETLKVAVLNVAPVSVALADDIKNTTAENFPETNLARNERIASNSTMR